MEITLDAATRTVSGKTLSSAFCDGRWQQPRYFYGRFDKPLKADRSGVAEGAATMVFDLNGEDRSVEIKIGISSVSVANAKLNLEAENAKGTFDETRAAAAVNWNDHLNTIQLDLAKPGGMKDLTDAQKMLAEKYLVQFYSAFYRTMGAPTVYSDVNGQFRGTKQVDLNDPSGDQSPAPERAAANVADYKFKVDGKDAGYATHYSTFSMWDTYRSLHHLQALLFPGQSKDMMQSLVVDAQQCGAFPHWVDGSEDTVPMSGDHAPNVIAGSYSFGVRGFDVETARKYMKQSAYVAESKCNDKLSMHLSDDASQENEIRQRKFYFDRGWVVHKYNSSTLEAVTSDQSTGTFLAGLATAPEDKADIDRMRARARNWGNIFNDTTKKLQGRNAQGEWGGNGWHESTEQNYIWTIAHDYASLIEKLGGKDAALARLNSLFSLGDKPFEGEGPSGRDLNGGETSQRYYIGNQPAFQTPWAYNWLGQAKYAQRIIPIIMRKNFSNGPGGLPGNDDLGSMSGWYVWAALGLYPTIPSAPGMAMSTPQFRGMTIYLGNSKVPLRIETDGEALIGDKPYIKEVKLNGKVYRGTWLPVKEIANGGTLSYTLSATPTDWGSDPALLPPSGPGADYTKPIAGDVSPAPTDAGVQIIQ